MVKTIFCCRRRPELTRQRYAELVLRGHAPLALAHHPTMRRYVINVAEGSPEEGPAYDSIAALCFDTLADYRERLYDSPEGREIIRRDVAGFLAGADAYATREHVHREAPTGVPRGERTPGIKWLVAVKRRPDLDRAAFLAHWHERHGPLVCELLPGLRRYVTNAVEERLSEGGEAWDGFAEVYFASPAEARAQLGDPAVRRGLDEDNRRFLSAAVRYPVAEYVQK